MGDDAFDWVGGNAGRVLVCRELAGIAPHAFTTRVLTFLGDREGADYAALAGVFGLNETDVIRVRQIHGRQIAIVRADEAPGDAADAIISLDPSRVIAVRVADCVPVLLADRGQRIVSAVHAGWRGTAAGVVTAVVEAIADLGVPASDLVAAIGPSIGPCCYQVSDDVRTACLRSGGHAGAWFASDGPGHWRLDLARANAEQLSDAGVSRGAIHQSRICTGHRAEDCFSYRRDGPGTGRMVAAIRLRT